MPPSIGAPRRAVCSTSYCLTQTYAWSVPAGDAPPTTTTVWPIEPTAVAWVFDEFGSSPSRVQVDPSDDDQVTDPSLS